MTENTTTIHVAADRMSANPLTLEPETSVREAGQAMARNHVHLIPVHSVHGGLLGVVSALDLLTCDDRDASISSLMRTHMETVKPDTSLAAVARLMAVKNLHHLLVVSDHKLLGVLSVFDLLPEVD